MPLCSYLSTASTSVDTSYFDHCSTCADTSYFDDCSSCADTSYPDNCSAAADTRITIDYLSSVVGPQRASCAWTPVPGSRGREGPGRSALRWWGGVPLHQGGTASHLVFGGQTRGRRRRSNKSARCSPPVPLLARVIIRPSNGSPASVNWAELGGRAPLYSLQAAAARCCAPARERPPGHS
jgi:hypothetical protein